jgi:predicted AAA+ superfamily ATPase
MWIEREISKELQEIAGSFPVVVLVGPRQVGKTSVLERTFAGHDYVALDVAANAEMAETRPDDFLRLHPPPLVLDEIQYAPGFFRTIKTVVDANRSRNGLFILSGSQNFLLMKNVADSLAGRAAIIPFTGLSGSEWQAAQTVADPPWREFLWRGGFPRLWDDPASPVSRDRWYQGYLATYLERDVRNLLQIGNLRDFERFLRACAARCAQTLNMSELGRDVGISATTARQWISVLQASNQIVLLEPYYRSLGKRLAKSPKLYFTDTGLAAFLMGFQSADSLWNSRSAGALWENHVVNQWQKWRDWHRPAASLWYWRDQAGNEVDLLVETDQRLIAVECKLTERPDSQDLRGLKRLSAFYGADAISHAYIACTTRQPYDPAPGITAINGWTVWKFPSSGDPQSPAGG